jgi:phosphoribosylanthranilate isomerase
MIIKICGMGDTVRMHQLAKLPVDMLGYIFYPKSPRYVVGKIDPAEMAKLPDNIHRVGVFVNAESEEIHEIAERYFLTAIQLHGNESPELCKELKAEGYTILKAFNISKENDYEAYSPHCDYFLFDTPSAQHGGTGQKFDWALLENYKGTTPFLLSGGIGPDDAEEVQKINHPQFAGIDINSKFEVEPGIKDVTLIKNFLSPQSPSNPLKGGLAYYKVDSSVHCLNETKPTYNDNTKDDLGVGKNMFYGAEPILFEFAKKNRLNPTEAEEYLWKQLSAVKLKGVRFKRQHPIIYFIADFYCHRAKLVIEVDGGYHKIPSQYEYDCNRDKELEELGLKVIRFTNEEVLSDIENVIKRVEEEIPPNPLKGGKEPLNPLKRT